MAGLGFDGPALGRADACSAGGFAFKQKRGAVRELGDGSEDAPVPDGGGDEVGAGLEVGGEVEALVRPVGEVAARGTVADALAVDPEEEAIVGADADDVGAWDGREVEGPAEVKHERVA